MSCAAFSELRRLTENAPAINADSVPEESRNSLQMLKRGFRPQHRNRVDTLAHILRIAKQTLEELLLNDWNQRGIKLS